MKLIKDSANHITGENLMDIDQNVLKEIGVKKIGDRVRIGSQAKAFRQQEYRRKRGSNRVSQCGRRCQDWQANNCNRARSDLRSQTLLLPLALHDHHQAPRACKRTQETSECLELFQRLKLHK